MIIIFVSELRVFQCKSENGVLLSFIPVLRDRDLWSPIVTHVSKTSIPRGQKSRSSLLRIIKGHCSAGRLVFHSFSKRTIYQYIDKCVTAPSRAFHALA